MYADDEVEDVTEVYEVDVAYTEFVNDAVCCVVGVSRVDGEPLGESETLNAGDVEPQLLLENESSEDDVGLGADEKVVAAGVNISILPGLLYSTA